MRNIRKLTSSIPPHSSPTVLTNSWRWFAGLVAKSRQTLCNTMDYSPFVHGISQARILEWIAISFSRESSRIRDGTHVSSTAGRVFTTESPGKPMVGIKYHNLLPLGWNDSELGFILFPPSFPVEWTSSCHILLNNAHWLAAAHFLYAMSLLHYWHSCTSQMNTVLLFRICRWGNQN